MLIICMPCSVADIRVDCCRSLGDNSLKLFKVETTGGAESWPEWTGGVSGEAPHVFDNGWLSIGIVAVGRRRSVLEEIQ
jgi:hypothetical protein